MTGRPDTDDLLGPIVGRALAAAASERERHERLWAMTPEQRLAAFYRGELSLGDCLAWARRHPKEPPLAADGEYLFIAVRTPEWADADCDIRRPSDSRGIERRARASRAAAVGTVRRVNLLREPVAVAIRLDGRAVRADTRRSAVGRDVLVFETAVPEAELALTLTSTYLGCPGADTVVSHACQSLGRAPRTWSRRLPGEEIPVWAAPHRCALDHLAQVQEALAETGRRAELELDEGQLSVPR